MRESGQLYGEPTERTAVEPPQALRGFVRSVGEDCPSGPFVLSSRVGGPGEESGAVLVLLLRSARSTRSALGAPVGGKQRFRCGSACNGRCGCGAERYGDSGGARGQWPQRQR